MKKSNNNNEDRLTLGSRYHHNNEPHGGHDLQTNKLPQKYENYDARRPTEKKGISQNAAIFFLFFSSSFPHRSVPGRSAANKLEHQSRFQSSREIFH